MNTQRIVSIVVACLVNLACLSCAGDRRAPVTGAEPAVRDLAQFEADLRAACAGAPDIRLEEAGRVDWEGFSAPIWVVHVERPGATSRVLVEAGTHGNEPAGPAWALELARTLASDPGAYPGASFDIVPLLNPWGWSRDVRQGRDGRDINRDFARFATQEARIFRDVVRGTRYDFAIDHHEDNTHDGFYLYQYANADTGPARRLIGALRNRGYRIEQDARFSILRTKDGLIRAPRWGLWYVKAAGTLSLTNWLRLEGIPKVSTIETPTSLPMADRVELHRTAFASLLGDVLEGGSH